MPHFLLSLLRRLAKLPIESAIFPGKVSGRDRPPTVPGPLVPFPEGTLANEYTWRVRPESTTLGILVASHLLRVYLRYKQKLLSIKFLSQKTPSDI